MAIVAISVSSRFSGRIRDLTLWLCLMLTHETGTVETYNNHIESQARKLPVKQHSARKFVLCWSSRRYKTKKLHPAVMMKIRWEWWVDGSATQRTGRVRIGQISAWLTERSRELIPELWRPYRWCKWCGAPGPWPLGAHQRGQQFFEKLISSLSHVASHSGYCSAIVF